MIKHFINIVKERGYKNTIFYKCKGFTYLYLFREIRRVLQIFELLKISKESTIALWGENSFMWIVIFLTCLIRGVRIVLIHPRESILNVEWQIQKSDATMLFVDKKLLQMTDLQTHPFLNTIISTDLKYIGVGSEEKNTIKLLKHILEGNPKEIDEETSDKYFKTFDYDVSENDIGYIKYVDDRMIQYDIDNIQRGLIVLHDKVYHLDALLVSEKEISFVEDPMLLVLFPLLTESPLFISNSLSPFSNNVIITKKKDFERIWNEFEETQLKGLLYKIFPRYFGRKYFKAYFPQLKQILFFDNLPRTSIQKKLRAYPIEYALRTGGKETWNGIMNLC